MPRTLVFAGQAEDETRRFSRCSMKQGEDVTGRLIEEDDTRLAFIPNPLSPERVEVRHADVQSRELAKLSPMPEGLLNILTKEEMLDLLAFLASGGKSSAPAFKKKAGFGE